MGVVSLEVRVSAGAERVNNLVRAIRLGARELCIFSASEQEFQTVPYRRRVLTSDRTSLFVVCYS